MDKTSDPVNPLAMHESLLLDYRSLKNERFAIISVHGGAAGVSSNTPHSFKNKYYNQRVCDLFILLVYVLRGVLWNIQIILSV